MPFRPTREIRHASTAARFLPQTQNQCEKRLGKPVGVGLLAIGTMARWRRWRVRRGLPDAKEGSVNRRPSAAMGTIAADRSSRRAGLAVPEVSPGA